MKLAFGVWTKPEALWVKVIRSKVVLQSVNGNKIPKYGLISYLWIGILSVWETVKNGMRWRLGNGNTCRFWQDKWLESG